MSSGSWTKIILVLIPFLLLVFIYVVHEQNATKHFIQKQTTEFNKDWHQMQKNFTGGE